MTSMKDALINYLSAENIPFYQTESDHHLLIPIAGNSGSLKCIAEAREDQRQVLFITILPITVPIAKLLAVAEYIARVNATLTIGSFELDFDDGLVAFRTSSEFGPEPPTTTLLRPLAHHAIAMADKYTPGIMDIVIANVLPIDALDSIERYSLNDVLDLASELLG